MPLKTPSDFNATTATCFKLLIIGEPFTGKTVLATSFPNPGVCDADGKLANAVNYHRLRNPAFDFRYCTVDVDENGKEVPEVARWPRYLKLMDELLADTWVKTIIPDSLTKIADYLSAFLVAQPGSQKPVQMGGEACMTQLHWYPFSIVLQRHLAKLISCPKNVVVPVHVRVDKDEMTGQMEYRSSVGGALGKSLPKLFPNFWRCKTKVIQSTPACPRGVKYIIQTAPDTQFALGSALPTLPPEFEFDITTSAKMLGL
jgi:hypothetical protein